MSLHEHHTEHAVASPEITFAHEPAPNTKRIWRTFWILLCLTIAELALGLSHYAFHMEGFLLLFVKGAMIILSLCKAIYIVSIFMHLGDEIRNMRLTVLVPLLLFIWFILAFLWDGVAWRNLRNRYDKPATGQQVVPHDQHTPKAD
ncbi:MAG: cytochrome C oxidase subunit IV family protein [Chitinophagaceae bacterium]|nr:cytochrome C oxidase subunit IV family protein [Chitinophagaceae bacterium]